MYYKTGTSHSNYQNPAFLPMFVPQFSSISVELSARATCGSNLECLLDYAATGNARMASVTVVNIQTVNTTSRLFGKLNKIACHITLIIN